MGARRPGANCILRSQVTPARREGGLADSTVAGGRRPGRRFLMQLPVDDKAIEVILRTGFVVVLLLAGIVLERIVLSRLRKIAAATKWRGNEVLISAIYRMPPLWFAVAGIYGALVNAPLDPEVLSVLQTILAVGIIALVTVTAARVVVGFVRLYADRVEDVLPSTSIFINLTRLLVFLVGVLIIIKRLGYDITPILTALGVGGLAVALALQDTLSNLFSGLYIVAARQVRPGEYIKLDSGEEGYVTDVTWRNTTIRQLPNNLVIVPNSKLASAILTNFNRPEKELAVRVQVAVSYASDLAHVEAVTIAVAKEIMTEIPGGIPEFDPVIRFHTFGDSSINFTVVMRAREFVDQYLITHEFIKRLHKRYQEEGIEIPFPIRTVYLKREEEVEGG